MNLIYKLIAIVIAAAVFTEQQSFPNNCIGILKIANRSGVYNIQLNSCSSPFRVYCEMNLAEGGWITIQRRMDGSVDFFRDWSDYRDGFGDMKGEFFLGLQKIHLLTVQRTQRLLIVLEDFEGVRKYAGYSEFGIDNEKNRYNLTKLGAYSGNAGDSLGAHKYHSFRTRDIEDPNNCPKRCMGGWWYTGKQCFKSNLNGLYLRGVMDKDRIGMGIIWTDYRTAAYSLRYVRMLIRPAS